MHLADEEATHALGLALGHHAQPGDLVALVGELGAGKSVLSRGIARGLGLTERIPSPTFVIVNTYEDGRLPFNHLDLYRLEGDDALEQLGLEDLWAGAVSAVEWPDAFFHVLPPDHLRIVIDDVGEGRMLTVTPTGPSSTRWWRLAAP